MDIQTIVLIITSIISGASIILNIIAPLTKNKVDDKVLKILKMISLNVKEDKTLDIKIKTK